MKGIVIVRGTKAMDLAIRNGITNPMRREDFERAYKRGIPMRYRDTLIPWSEVPSDWLPWQAAIVASIPQWNNNVGTSVTTLTVNDHLNASMVYIMNVCGYIAASDPNIPTMTGDFSGWVQGPSRVVTQTGAHIRITMFAIDGPKTAGNMTADFGGQTQDKISMSIDEFAGAQVAANLFVASNIGNASGDSGTPSCSIPNALADANNKSYACAFSVDTSAETAGASMTLIGSSPGGNGVSTEYGTSLSPAFVGAFGNAWHMVGTEINAAGVGGGSGYNLAWIRI